MLRPMTALPKSKMTVDDYLVWVEAQGGRWELIDGEPIRAESERVEHSEIKFAAGLALHEAIRRAKAPSSDSPRRGGRPDL